MYLTRRQREVYEFIRQFIEDRSYSPSLEEIARGLELSSLATVHKHLSNLAEKGVIRRHWNKGRGIELAADLGAPQMVHAELDAAYKLPIRGSVIAGAPLEAVELDSDQLSVPSEMIHDAEKTFVLRVRGDSMIEDGIHEDDFIIVERESDPKNGQVIVALVGGYETTVKRIYREGDIIRLQPANSSMEPIRVMAKDVEIQGKVIGLIRRYDR